MLNPKVEVIDRDLGMRAMIDRVTAAADHVDIGIHADEGEELVMIAAVHEYGATIHHPGGTAYGYQTKRDAELGRVRFLKGNDGFMVLGVTPPHTIEIPMRSFIRSTVDEKQGDYHAIATRLMGRIIRGELTKFDALSLMGQQIEKDIKRKITTLKYPPNAPSTIKKKGSSNPLIDTGHMRSSIRYVVKSAEDTAQPITSSGGT